MKTEKKLHGDFSIGTKLEIPVSALRTNGEASPSSSNDFSKPQVPPRMKKKGPALPAKPPHLRHSANSLTTAPTLTVVSPSQQAVNKQIIDQVKQQTNSNGIVNLIHPKSSPLTKQFCEDHPHTNSSQREVLVAASKAQIGNRPVERRQREPAKLLTAPLVPKKAEDSGEDDDLDTVLVRVKQRNNMVKAESKPSEPASCKKSEKSKGATIFNFRKNRAPMVLIPRGHPLLDARNLTHMWGGVYPTAYAMWLQGYDNGDPSTLSANSGLLRPIFGSSVDLRPYGVAGQNRSQQRSRADAMGPRSGAKHLKSSKYSSSVASSAKPRSSSVTRSGSLTSHGSTSSDSGNETFPKSVLKKQKRNSNKIADRPEQKKNVTFNAFATVQLMEE